MQLRLQKQMRRDPKSMGRKREDGTVSRHHEGEKAEAVTDAAVANKAESKVGMMDSEAGATLNHLTTSNNDGRHDGPRGQPLCHYDFADW